MSRHISAALIGKYGEDYYSRIGRIGGQKSAGRFKVDRKLAAKAGRIGGLSTQERKRHIDDQIQIRVRGSRKHAKKEEKC